MHTFLAANINQQLNKKWESWQISEEFVNIWIKAVMTSSLYFFISK